MKDEEKKGTAEEEANTEEVAQLTDEELSQVVGGCTVKPK